MRETGVPTVQAQVGCSHVAWGQSRWTGQPQFVVVTRWDSVAALEAFAGPRWQEAVIEPEEEHMLAQVFCDHYETTETADGLGVPGKNPVMPRLEHGNEPGGPAQQHQNRKFAKVRSGQITVAQRMFAAPDGIASRGRGRLRAVEQISWQVRRSEMPKAPIVYKSTHRIKFSELDPYGHVDTGNYATYYVDHRMEGLRDHAGWDLKTLGTLPFMVWVRRIEIDFLRPARGDQEITITSFVREFRGSDALIECTMTDSAGKDVSLCLMIVAHVDKETNRATDWPPDIMALFLEKTPEPGAVRRGRRDSGVAGFR